MNKRWFAVILTVGLLLCLVPMSAFALNSDCITDSDGNILGWDDLNDPDPVDMVWEQAPEPASTASDTPTQPHQPAETNDVQNSAAADSSEVSMTSAESEFNTDELYADELYPDELYAVSAVDDSASTTEPDVCKIGEKTYKSLQDAIDAASPNDQIDLLQDITLETGLTFDSKTLTIDGGGIRTLTLKKLGMHATNLSEITFKDLTLIIKAHTNPSGAGATANLIYRSKLRLSHVEFTLTPDELLGSGICLYNDSDLYFEDNTNAVIDGFSADLASGIYADADSYSEDVTHEVRVSSSTLTVTDSGWNGMTINPVNFNLIDSHVTLYDNGKGGLGCYYGKLKMENSILDANNNGKKGSIEFGTRGSFVDELDMDGYSVLNANNNNGIAGLLIGDGGVIRSGAVLNCNNNAYIGLYVFTDGNWLGDVVIEPGATVTACNNAYSGVHNAYKLKIKGTVIADSNKAFGITNDAGDKLIITSTADVSACQNLVFGIFNYDNANLTVNSGASLKVEENTGSGILNGRNATLNLNAGSIQRNNARYAIQGYVAHGGGIQNWGTATLSDDVELYNNHTATCGDDIYNADGATITFGATGEGWALDGAPDCYDDIDGWYDDSKNARWNAHAEDEADLHTVQIKPGTFNNVLALKAAHGFHPTGTLIISKAISGALEPDDCGTDFNFVLTLADSSITTTDAEKYGVVFEDGKASFTLKDSEIITVANLPAGMSYTLAEQSKGGWRLAWVDGDAEGVVPRRAAATITFINEKLPTTGSLVVSKQITGDLNPEDADTVFHFVLMLNDDTLTTADTEEYGVAFESGWASFTLKGGESITIGSLPAGVGYTIAETRQNGWTLQSVSGETTGVIPQNGTVEIAFVNQKDDGSIPVAPVDPIEPVLPIEPVEPVEPGMPAETETPAEPVTPEVPETPAQDEAPVLPQTPEPPAKADASVSTLPQTGTPGWMAMALLSFGCVLLACGWFLTRRQRRMK